jgi:phosphatidylinositol alpha-1,6-mannosyltransferase
VANAYLWGLNLVRPGLRHFYTDHNSRTDRAYRGPTGWKKACKRLLLKRYEQVWCVSEFVQNSLAAQGTWSNSHCCLHFINTDRFRPDPAARAQMRREHGVEDRFVVTVIAQLIRDKGIDLAIRALSELPEKAVLWIVGAGAQADELRALAGTLAVANRVRFWGLQRQVEPFLQASDCFVLPSRWQEAAGLVVLEAQAAGLPVVASRIGGIPEYIAEGQSGLLFTPNDARDLAVQLRQLCLDPPRRERMATEARLHAVERFSAEIRLPELLERYRGHY